MLKENTGRQYETFGRRYVIFIKYIIIYASVHKLNMYQVPIYTDVWFKGWPKQLQLVLKKSGYNIL